MSLSLVRVPWDDPDAAGLRAIQQAEIATRYGGVADIEPELPPEQMVATVVLRSTDGDGLTDTVACVSLRDASRLGAAVGGGDGVRVGEIKRMFVVPEARGHGHAHRLLAEVERLALEHGFDRLVLETGSRQAEAIGLYLAHGYLPIEKYGPYVGEKFSRCFARDLRADARPTDARPDGASRTRPDVRAEAVPFDHPVATQMRIAMISEMDRLYGPEGRAQGAPEVVAAQGRQTALVTLLLLDGTEPVGHVSLRTLDPDPALTAAGVSAEAGRVAEVKRLYVEPAHRGRGHARALMAACEAVAPALGRSALALQTGTRQAGAVALYVSLGYRATQPYAHHEENPESLCFVKPVGGRVASTD